MILQLKNGDTSLQPVGTRTDDSLAKNGDAFLWSCCNVGVLQQSAGTCTHDSLAEKAEQLPIIA